MAEESASKLQFQLAKKTAEHEEAQGEIRRSTREIAKWRDKYQASQNDLQTFKDRCDDLLQKLASTDSEKNVSNSKCNKLSDALTEKDEELHSKKDLLPEHKLMLDKLQKELDQQTSLVQKSNAANSDLDSKIKQLNEDLESSRAANSELRNTVEDLQNRVSTADKRFESSQKLQLDLEKEADDCRKEKNQAESKCQELEIEIKDVKGLLDRRRRASKDIDNDLKNSKMEVSRLNKELVKSAELHSSKVADLEAKIETKNAEDGALQNSLDDARAKVSSLESELITSQSSCSALENSVSEINKKCSELEEALTSKTKEFQEAMFESNKKLVDLQLSTNTKNEDLQRELNSKVNSINELETKLEESRERLKSVEQEVSDEKLKSADLQKFLDKKHSKLTDLQNSLDSTTSSMSSANEKLKAKLSSYEEVVAKAEADLVAKISEYDGLLKSSGEQVKSLDDQRVELESTCASLKSEKEELDIKFQESGNTLLEVRAELESRKKKCCDLEITVGTRDEEIQRLTEVWTLETQSVEQLEQQLRQQKTSFSALEKKLEDTKNVCEKLRTEIVEIQQSSAKGLSEAKSILESKLSTKKDEICELNAKFEQSTLAFNVQIEELEESIASKEKVISDLTETVEKMDSDLSESKKMLADLTEISESNKIEFASELESVKSDLTNQLEQQMNTVADFESQLVQEKQLTNVLEEHKKNLVSRVSHLESESTKLHATIAEKEDFIRSISDINEAKGEELLTKVADLTCQLDEMSKALSSKTDEMDGLESKIRILEIEKNDLDKQKLEVTISHEAKLAEIEDGSADLKSALENSKIELQNSKQELQKQVDANFGLNQTLKMRSTKASELQEEVESLRGEKERLFNENNSLKTTLNSRSSAISRLEEDVLSKTKIVDELQSANSSASNSLAETNEKLVSEVKTLKLSLDDKKFQLSKLSTIMEEKEVLESERQDYENQLNELRERCRELKSEQREFAESESSELEKLKAKNDELQQTVTRVEVQKTSIEDLKKSLEHRCAEQGAELQRLYSQNENLEQTRRKSLTEEASHQQTICKMEDTIHSLKRELDSANVKLVQNEELELAAQKLSETTTLKTKLEQDLLSVTKKKNDADNEANILKAKVCRLETQNDELETLYHNVLNDYKAKDQESKKRLEDSVKSNKKWSEKYKQLETERDSMERTSIDELTTSSKMAGLQMELEGLKLEKSKFEGALLEKERTLEMQLVKKENEFGYEKCQYEKKIKEQDEQLQQMSLELSAREEAWIEDQEKLSTKLKNMDREQRAMGRADFEAHVFRHQREKMKWEGMYDECKQRGQRRELHYKRRLEAAGCAPSPEQSGVSLDSTSFLRTATEMTSASSSDGAPPNFLNKTRPVPSTKRAAPPGYLSRASQDRSSDGAGEVMTSDQFLGLNEKARERSRSFSKAGSCED